MISLVGIKPGAESGPAAVWCVVDVPTAAAKERHASSLPVQAVRRSTRSLLAKLMFDFAARSEAHLAIEHTEQPLALGVLRHFRRLDLLALKYLAL
eukprot:3312690-Rhodomonas_salina.2